MAGYHAPYGSRLLGVPDMLLLVCVVTSLSLPIGSSWKVEGGTCAWRGFPRRTSRYFPCCHCKVPLMGTGCHCCYSGGPGPAAAPRGGGTFSAEPQRRQYHPWDCAVLWPGGVAAHGGVRTYRVSPAMAAADAMLGALPCLHHASRLAGAAGSATWVLVGRPPQSRWQGRAGLVSLD